MLKSLFPALVEANSRYIRPRLAFAPHWQPGAQPALGAVGRRKLTGVRTGDIFKNHTIMWRLGLVPHAKARIEALRLMRPR